MLVKVLRGFCLGGGVDVAPGDVVEMEPKDALVKISQAKVEPVEDDEYPGAMHHEGLDTAGLKHGRNMRFKK